MNSHCTPLPVSPSATLPRVKAKACASVRLPWPTKDVSGGKRVQLQQRELYRHRLAAGEVLALQVLTGQLWVTMENDAADHVLPAGSRSVFIGPGLLVMEALEAPAMVLTGAKSQG